MVQDETSSATAQAASANQSRQRIQSEIEFPYADLEAAVDLVQRIRTNAGAACDDEEIAAWMDMSVHGGTFRARRSSAAMFGLIEAAGRRLTLTPLGQRAVDETESRAARVDAFLRPQLFNVMYEHWRGQVLPPPAAIERQMGELGVPPKQKARARQVFQKSAHYAGFIDPTSGRFVRPSSTTQATERQQQPPAGVDQEHRKGGAGSGGGSDDPPRHPLIEGLFQSLPPDGEIMTLDEAVDWLQAAVYNLRFAYKFQGRIKVSVEGQDAIPIRNGGNAS